MTLAIPDGLSIRMKKFPEIRWSEIARQAIEKRISDLELMNRIASKSKLTQKDVEEIGKSIKASAAKKLHEYSR
jgi:hypothetical protein